MEKPESSSPSEAEQLDAAIAALEAERARRFTAEWLAGKRQIEVRIIDEGRTLSAAEAVADPPEHGVAPMVMELHVVNPAPIVELPSWQWDQPVNARDVTPRPPMPSPAAPPAK